MPYFIKEVNTTIVELGIAPRFFLVAGYFRRSPPVATGGNLQNNPKTADSCCSDGRWPSKM